MAKMFIVALVFLSSNLYAMSSYTERNLTREMAMSKIVLSADKFDTFDKVRHFVDTYKDNVKPDGYLENTIASILERALQRGIVPKAEVESVQKEIWFYTSKAIKFGRINALQRVLAIADEKQRIVSLGLRLMFLPSIESYAELTDFALNNPVVAKDVKLILGEEAKLVRYRDIPRADTGKTFFPPLSCFKFSRTNLGILKGILAKTTENSAKCVLIDIIDEFMKDEYLETIPEKLK